MSGKDSRDRKRGSSDNRAFLDASEAQTLKHNTSETDKDMKKPKLTMGFSKKVEPLKSPIGGEKKGIQMKLGGQASSIASSPAAAAALAASSKAKPTAVAAAFNEDSDSEPEEMPPEAKMRMRNIGRETPTSAGPNSFGKTKQGFCDAKKVFEKSLKKAQDTVSSTNTKS